MLEVLERPSDRVSKRREAPISRPHEKGASMSGDLALVALGDPRF